MYGLLINMAHCKGQGHEYFNCKMRISWKWWQNWQRLPLSNRKYLILFRLKFISDLGPLKRLRTCMIMLFHCKYIVNDEDIFEHLQTKNAIKTDARQIFIDMHGRRSSCLFWFWQLSWFGVKPKDGKVIWIWKEMEMRHMPSNLPTSSFTLCH